MIRAVQKQNHMLCSIALFVEMFKEDVLGQVL